MPVVLYCMVAIIIGQLFGERFAWSQIWPSGLVLGAGLSTWFIVGVIHPIVSDPGRRNELIAGGLFAFSVGTAFFGLFFSGVWWLFPRIIGVGFIDFPKYAWAVQV